LAFEKWGGLVITVPHHLKFGHTVGGFILAMGFVDFSCACQKVDLSFVLDIAEPYFSCQIHYVNFF